MDKQVNTSGHNNGTLTAHAVKIKPGIRHLLSKTCRNPVSIPRLGLMSIALRKSMIGQADRLSRSGYSHSDRSANKL
jgi:hypothetical protein